MVNSPYQDSIGNRLDHPDRVPPEYRHLIADDQQRVKRILEFPVSGRVLDVGCSDGAITRRIADGWPLARVSGCDLAVQGPQGVDYYAWPVTMPFPSPPYVPVRFDTIYCCEVFEHLTDADAQLALTNIEAVLKPGGDLIVTVPNRDCAEPYVAGCRDRWKWPDHRSAWTADKLEDWLLAAGFTNLEEVPVYLADDIEDGIWLIVRAKGKR